MKLHVSQLKIQQKFLESKIAHFKSPIGIVKIMGSENGIQSITILDDSSTFATKLNNIPECLVECIKQLDEYFQGNRTSFDLKLNPEGTSFQQKVWKELLQIPFGKTRTYLDQAKKIGNVKAIRAVANANGKNPICIVIPCHRIIGSDGSLTGYAGGLKRKQWLLNHESPNKQQSLF